MVGRLGLGLAWQRVGSCRERLAAMAARRPAGARGPPVGGPWRGDHRSGAISIALLQAPLATRAVFDGDWTEDGLQWRWASGPGGRAVVGSGPVAQPTLSRLAGEPGQPARAPAVRVGSCEHRCLRGPRESARPRTVPAVAHRRAHPRPGRLPGEPGAGELLRRPGHVGRGQCPLAAAARRAVDARGRVAHAARKRLLAHRQWRHHLPRPHPGRAGSIFNGGLPPPGSAR